MNTSKPNTTNKEGKLIFTQLELYRPKNLLVYIRKQNIDELLQNYINEAKEMGEEKANTRLKHIEKMKDF